MTTLVTIPQMYERFFVSIVQNHTWGMYQVALTDEGKNPIDITHCKWEH